MADKEKKPESTGKSTGKWKASSSQRYRESYGKDTPHFQELSNGRAVTLDPKSNFFKNKIEQKIIVKE